MSLFFFPNYYVEVNGLLRIITTYSDFYVFMKVWLDSPKTSRSQKFVDIGEDEVFLMQETTGV